jgi:hypothetical protein
MHSYFNERHSRSMKMLSRNRPRPSIEIRPPELTARRLSAFKNLPSDWTEQKKALGLA